MRPPLNWNPIHHRLASDRVDSDQDLCYQRPWLFNESGELIIAKLTPSGYEEIDRAKVIEPTNTAFGRDVVWSMPAFANKKAFIRNDEEIICIDLEKK